MLDLKSLIKHSLNSKLYSEKFKDVSDFKKLPFLEHNEILQRPLDLLTDKQNVASKIYFSSGTTGKPKTFFFSIEDIENISNLCKRFSILEGVNSSDRVLIILPMALWSVGELTKLGHIKTGASVIPVDLSSSALINVNSIINIIKPTIISSTPSVLMEYIKKYDAPQVRIIETTGEKLTDEMRNKIESAFGGVVYDAYGLSEAVIGVECEVHDGYHYWEDYVILEVIDPNTNEEIEEGEIGEIVVTCLKRNLMPIIRYKTGDLGRITKQRCICGLNTPRVFIEERKEFSIQLSAGVSITHSQIRKVFDKIFGETPNSVEILISHKEVIDKLYFKITCETLNDDKYVIQALQNISIDFLDLIRLNLIEIEVSSAKSMKEDMHGSVIKFIDLRT